MKNIVKKSLYILVVILVCILVFLKLKHNKETTAKITGLASVKGSFYPVRTMDIKPEQLTTTITANGFLQSETDLTVRSETQGTIRVIYKRKGDYVTSGEVIAKVDDESQAAQFAASKAAYEQSKKDVQRFTRLQEQNAVPSQKLEEIKLNCETAEARYVSAKRQLEDTRIKAPVGGFIEDDFIETGQFISGGNKICNIIDTGNLKLKIAIPEQDYRHIQLGQPARITSSVYPTIRFKGQISYLGEKAGYGNSFNAELKIANPNNLLKAGMFVSALMVEKHENQGIYIPRQAINGSLKDASVYIIINGKAVSKVITAGNIIENQVQVLKGLKTGDKLVTEGNYSIFNGATVKVIK